MQYRKQVQAVVQRRPGCNLLLQMQLGQHGIDSLVAAPSIGQIAQQLIGLLLEGLLGSLIPPLSEVVSPEACLGSPIDGKHPGNPAPCHYHTLHPSPGLACLQKGHLYRA